MRFLLIQDSKMMFYLFLPLCFAPSVVWTESMSLPGCSSECGNLTIPFPFGLTSECCFDESFHTICDSRFEPPKPFLRRLDVEVAAISLHEKLELLISSSPSSSSSSSNLVVEDSEGEILPMVVDWAVGDAPCHMAQTNGSRYACRSLQSQCLNSSTGQGHTCRCLPGYQGNPYLADGCQDIDECAVSNPCERLCVNLCGSFKCYCPEGMVGDGRKDGTACSDANQINQPSALAFFIPIGIFVVLQFLAITFGACIGTIENKLEMGRRQNFERNGGNMLERKLSSRNPELKIYPTEDMNSIARNFIDEIDMPRCKPGEKFHRGTLPADANNNSPSVEVVVATVERVPEGKRKEFVDQLIFLSKPHANLVRVLGCCLDKPSPVIVYELHGDGSTTLCNFTRSKVRLSREAWLNTAAGVAKGLAHFDSYKFSTALVHGDICSANIMMDTTSYEPKIFCAAGSNLIPRPPDQENSLYADPEKLNQRSDVYSFGVVLVELLIVGWTVSPNTGKFDRGVMSNAIVMAQANTLLEILDEEMIREGELVREVAALAHRCLNVRSNQRPKMKKVSKKLTSLMRMA